MLRFRRYISVSRNLLQAISKDQSQSYTKLFKQPYFHKINEQLNKRIETLEPYELSNEINNVVKDLKYTEQEASVVHNKIIEELTKYNFGIATIQSRILNELKQKLSTEALLQLIEHNPGRIKSSWELFVNNVKDFEEVPDELLAKVLSKVVNFDFADIKDGKKTMTVADVTNASYILTNIKDKTLIDQKLIDRITTAILESNATKCLPVILSYSPSLNVFSQKYEELSNLQTYYIFKSYPFEDLRASSSYVYNLTRATGRPDALKATEEEIETNKLIDEQITNINKSLNKKWTISTPELEPDQVEKNFFRILEDLQNGNRIDNDFGLAKLILRIFSLSRGNIEEFMNFYVKCGDKFEERKDEIAFEAYLAYSYKAFKTGDASFLQAAQNWLPKLPQDAILRTNILRVAILTDARFDIEKSLNIFNDNVQNLSKEKNEHEAGSQCDLVTESLILAYLYKQDIDFARMVLDKAMGEKLFSGKAAVRNIKKHLAGYGEAVENKTLQIFLDEDICEYLQNL
ncbi:similar to Saccharomyces cerevisiae YJR003C Putative protein of unknown function [Maudiozyma saulgeensis]|uniref:Mitochondrial group I intron splicing factor CCM1 n=1 Tax=Maudiozyma saulgeensis TaxID=1789683 RepID=A0A1X7R020_9SACH|nr:similar to Saccharomyces cerevisiae YJR003C Putative protein of unknown function [Kazachstania saulgeensis]